MRFRHFFPVAFAALIVSCLTVETRAAIANAFLSFDFQRDGDPTEVQFQTNNGAQSGSYNTAEGNITVSTSSDQFYGRGAPTDGGSLTYGELYNDFVYNNGSGGAIDFTLSGPAIHPNISYQITWYAYDFSSLSDTTITFSSTALSNTTGSIGTVFFPTGGTGVPTTDSQYSFTGIWTATDNSLEITGQANVGSAPRINGFEIVALPEPTGGLFAVTLISLVAGRRARQAR